MHTLKGRTWKHKTWGRNTNLAKNIDYFKKKVKSSNGWNFLHNLLETTLYSLLFLREKKSKRIPLYIHFPNLLKKILIISSTDHL
jgi:hypothetical protein